MSLSNPKEQNPSPSKRSFKWGGGEGQLSWHNKDEKDENKRKVVVALPFRFIILDTLNSVNGYNKKRKCGIYSNEVRSAMEELTVKWADDNSVIAKGIWADIKDKVNGVSGGFCSVNYIAFKESPKEPFVIGKLNLSGCALGPFFDFRKKAGKALNEKGVMIKAGTLNDEGPIKFTPPTFDTFDITPEMLKEAIALDGVLQAYLDKYFSRGTAPVKPRDSDSQPDSRNIDAQADAHASEQSDNDGGDSGGDW